MNLLTKKIILVIIVSTSIILLISYSVAASYQFGKYYATPLYVLFADPKSDNSTKKAQIAKSSLCCYRNKQSGLVYFDFSQNWKSSNSLECLRLCSK